MRLCDIDIENFLENKKIIINPKPKLSSISGITIDIHLGNKFRIFKNNKISYINLRIPKNKINNLLNNIISKEIILKKEKPFFLHPMEFALAITEESVKLPNNIVAWLDGRSLLARIGLMVHATSHRIDPGWNGNIVLEFFNMGKLPIALFSGMIIGAISFELLSKDVKKPYNYRNNSRYRNQNDTTI